MKSTPKLSLVVLPFILIATASLLYFGALAPNAISSVLPVPLSDNTFIDGKLKYQLVSFGTAIFLLGITFALSGKNAKIYYQAGNLSAHARPIGWLGIKPTDTWKTIGRNFSIIVSLATGVFIYLNVARGQTLESTHLKYFPFILVFAVMNAFTEEAITRLSLVTALKGVIPDSAIYLASALLFGIPHYFGVPGGIVGALMAAFLGWLLSKSIVETQGIFWAWFIHFLQDVIIFSALLMVFI